jgi:octaprenyl-diphosphate synthase
VRAGLQIEKARRLDITEVYYDIITKKTATLIAACCSLGALLLVAQKVQMWNAQIWRIDGICAFQIKDDDYGNQRMREYLQASILGSKNDIYH